MEGHLTSRSLKMRFPVTGWTVPKSSGTRSLPLSLVSEVQRLLDPLLIEEVTGSI